MPCVAHTPPRMLSRLWRVPSDVAGGMKKKITQLAGWYTHIHTPNSGSLCVHVTHIHPSRSLSRSTYSQGQQWLLFIWSAIPKSQQLTFAAAAI